MNESVSWLYDKLTLRPDFPLKPHLQYAGGEWYCRLGWLKPCRGETISAAYESYRKSDISPRLAMQELFLLKGEFMKCQIKDKAWLSTSE